MVVCGRTKPDLDAIAKEIGGVALKVDLADRAAVDAAMASAGHVDVLFAARATADALVVGINSDDSVRRLKGPTRPVRTDAERAYVLAALECVDLVVIFPEDTPLNLVRHIKPDVIVKGGDYSEDTIVGAAEVKSWGGRVVVVPLTPGHSTTAIIRKLGEIS